MIYVKYSDWYIASTQNGSCYNDNCLNNLTIACNSFVIGGVKYIFHSVISPWCARAEGRKNSACKFLYLQFTFLKIKMFRSFQAKVLSPLPYNFPASPPTALFEMLHIFLVSSFLADEQSSILIKTPNMLIILLLNVSEKGTLLTSSIQWCNRMMCKSWDFKLFKEVIHHLDCASTSLASFYFSNAGFFILDLLHLTFSFTRLLSSPLCRARVHLLFQSHQELSLLLQLKELFPLPSSTHDCISFMALIDPQPCIYLILIHMCLPQHKLQKAADIFILLLLSS